MPSAGGIFIFFNVLVDLHETNCLIACFGLEL